MFIHLWLWLTTKRQMKRPKTDVRDFDVGIFGWGTYKRKHHRHINETLSVKDQSGRNTCVFEEAIVQKEPDEGYELSVRSIVAYADAQGWIKQNGFADLRAGLKVLKEWGALKLGQVEEKFVSWGDWVKVDINKWRLQASKHKIKSYWGAWKLADVYKLLDDGKILTSAMKWFTGFNMQGGFKAPFIIHNGTKRGLPVGYHDYAIIGYDDNFYGMDVMICQNSYSEKWGEDGKFYIEISRFINACLAWPNNFGAYAAQDIDADVGKFVKKYNFHNVKSKNNSSCYLIQAGKKLPYPNWLTYLSFNGKKPVDIVLQSELDKVPTGEVMNIKKSRHYDFLKDVAEDKQSDELLAYLWTIKDIE